MNITLTPELEQFMQTQVENGKYSSMTEVVLAGITLLKEIEQIYQGRYEELRRQVQVGIEAAEREEVLDSDTVFESLQTKLDQKRYQGS